jgi:tetratricopeptide (TPR) repeat protein
LYERCLSGIADEGGNPGLEARYATLLSCAFSDMGDLVRAEQVVGSALARLDDTVDPYMRVRLYWSMARLAHTEGRASVALGNIRKAIALLQATDDTLHLARAHILAANITLSREDADGAARHLDRAEQLLGMPIASDDLVEIAIQRSRIAALREEGAHAVTFARSALELNAGKNSIDEGRAFAALGDGLALEGQSPAAEEAFRRAADMLETSGRWRDAANVCRAWARVLRDSQDEQQALDVLERAAELATRAQPAETHAER